jgi:hypothetical protein
LRHERNQVHVKKVTTKTTQAIDEAFTKLAKIIIRFLKSVSVITEMRGMLRCVEIVGKRTAMVKDRGQLKAMRSHSGIW